MLLRIYLEEDNMRENRLIIYFAIVVHLIWGIVLLFNKNPIHTSTLSDLYKIISNHYTLGLLLIIFALLAFWGLRIKSSSIVTNIIPFLPQQFIILVSAITAITAIVKGQYADGVVRPFSFIFTDQLSALVIAVMYTIAIFEPVWLKKGEENE